VELRDDRHVPARFDRSERCPLTGQSSADNHDIVSPHERSAAPSRAVL